MFEIWVVFHVLICVSLIVVVLLQSSKGEGLAGSAFGGNISGAVFGGRGAASFLSKATTVLAITFMVNCIVLAYMSAGTRTIAQGGSAPDGTAESVVTQKAQEERDRALQQQQQQQLQLSDTAVTITPGEAAPAVPQDTTGN